LTTKTIYDIFKKSKLIGISQIGGAYNISSEVIVNEAENE
jgi:hypothetical protein